MNEVKFEGLSKKIKTIEVDGEKLKIKPKRKDVVLFCTLSRANLTEEDANKIFDILIEMIHRANPEADPADIEAYVTEHFGSLIMQIAPLFGFSIDPMMLQDLNLKKTTQ